MGAVEVERGSVGPTGGTVETERRGGTIRTMGNRGRSESVVGVLSFFFQKQKRWSQAAIARELDLRVEAVRKILVDLQASGVPLTPRAERPHVYWTMRKDWVPHRRPVADANLAVSMPR